jgi:hypothetical protein
MRSQVQVQPGPLHRRSPAEILVGGLSLCRLPRASQRIAVRERIPAPLSSERLGQESSGRLTVKRYGECRYGRLPDERAGASATGDPEAPGGAVAAPTAYSNRGSWRTWLLPSLWPSCGLPATWPWARMQVSRRRPGRVGPALGAPDELGAVTTRMGSGMRAPVAEVSALLIRGGVWRRRLALRPVLAEAAAAAPGEAEPAANGRLIQSWCG